MVVLVLFVDLTQVVAISTFGTLFYYALANVAAFRLKTENRQYSRVVPALGISTCLLLLIFVLFAAPQTWIIGFICLFAGAVYYGVRKKHSSTKDET
jgi:APA family basic amino acid/polyamine antiporter